MRQRDQAKDRAGRHDVDLHGIAFQCETVLQGAAGPAGRHTASSAASPSYSDNEVIESHVLRARRTEHGVSVKALRQPWSLRRLGIERLLLRPEPCSDAGHAALIERWLVA